MSTRRRMRNTKSGESREPSIGSVSRARLDSNVTVLAIEEALAELGIHARLSEIVAKAQCIENRIIQSRPRRKREQVC